MDAATLFARLYDRLDDSLFGDGTVDQWLLDRALRVRSSQVAAAVTATGRFSGVLVGTPEDDFAVCRGVDRALEQLSPFASAPGLTPPGMSAIARRYAEKGILNNGEISGAVLFRCAYSGRPLGVGAKSDYFGLIRVPGHVWDRIDFAVIPSVLDLDVGPVARVRNRVGVGCAPTLESYDDLDIERTRRGRGGVRPAYRLTPRASQVVPRISRILDRLDAEHAVVGLIPESTLSPPILDGWLNALRSKAMNFANLTWIMVGTGPNDDATDPPRNRAVLLHRCGEVLIEQDKIHDFTLSRKQINDWGLDSHLWPYASRAEDITPGTRLQVRESNIGRLAIVICEDLTRGEWSELLRGCGVSHLLVPIFSTEVAKSWAQYGSEREVQELGAWVVVATSLAVPKACDPTKGSWSTSLSCGPKDDREEWEADETFGHTSQPDEVAIHWIRGGRVLRFDELI